MNDAQKQQFDSGARLDPVATRALIESYTPVDVVSAEYKKRFLELIDLTPDQFANRYNYYAGLPGHFTAQAVIYNPALNSIALMHHKKLDIWVGAGGHIDLEDENAEAAARREAQEEMGLTDLVLAEAKPLDLDIHGFPSKGDQPDHLHYDIRFLFTTTKQEFHANNESKSVTWVPVSNLDAYLPHWLANTRLKAALKARFGL